MNGIKHMVSMCLIPFHSLHSRCYYEPSSPHQPPVTSALLYYTSILYFCYTVPSYSYKSHEHIILSRHGNRQEHLIKDPPLFFKFSPKMTYPNLTACSSSPEARICIFLVPFERKHFEVCGNVKEMHDNITQ